MSKNSPILIDVGHGLSIMSGLPTLASWNNASRPESPKRGTFGFNVQTNTLEYFDGDNWFAVSMSED